MSLEKKDACPVKNACMKMKESRPQEHITFLLTVITIVILLKMQADHIPGKSEANMVAVHLEMIILGWIIVL